MTTKQAFEPMYVDLKSYDPEIVLHCAIEALKDLGYEPDEDSTDDNILVQASQTISGLAYDVICWWASERESKIALPSQFATSESAQIVGVLVTGENETLADIQTEQISDRIDQLLSDVAAESSNSPN